MICMLYIFLTDTNVRVGNALDDALKDWCHCNIILSCLSCIMEVALRAN